MKTLKNKKDTKHYCAWNVANFKKKFLQRSTRHVTSRYLPVLHCAVFIFVRVMLSLNLTLSTLFATFEK